MDELTVGDVVDPADIRRAAHGDYQSFGIAYRERVSHRCQRTDAHMIAECRDFPCPAVTPEECTFLREREVAGTNRAWLPCVHHDHAAGRHEPPLDDTANCEDCRREAEAQAQANLEGV